MTDISERAQELADRAEVLARGIQELAASALAVERTARTYRVYVTVTVTDTTLYGMARADVLDSRGATLEQRRFTSASDGIVWLLDAITRYERDFGAVDIMVRPEGGK